MVVYIVFCFAVKKNLFLFFTVLDWGGGGGGIQSYICPHPHPLVNREG